MKKNSKKINYYKDYTNYEYDKYNYFFLSCFVMMLVCGFLVAFWK